MEPYQIYPVSLIILFVLLIYINRRDYYIYKKFHKKKGNVKMPEKMLKEFIGKEVTVLMYNESFSYTGVITEVQDSWIKFETKKDVQIINGDMIRSITLKKDKKNK